MDRDAVVGEQTASACTRPTGLPAARQEGNMDLTSHEGVLGPPSCCQPNHSALITDRKIRQIRCDGQLR